MHGGENQSRIGQITAAVRLRTSVFSAILAAVVRDRWVVADE